MDNTALNSDVTVWQRSDNTTHDLTQLQHQASELLIANNLLEQASKPTSYLEPTNPPPSKSTPSNFWLTARTNARLKQQAVSIRPVARDRPLPASLNQERLYLLEQMQPDTTVHSLLHTIRFTGSLNITLLKQSLDEIIKRHETLRTTFVVVDGQLIQSIASNISWELPLIDLQTLPAEERELEVERLALADVQRPFDLANGSLWRFTLLRLNDTEHVLIRSIHHIIFDGYSHNLFMRELGAIYSAFVAGKPSALPELPIQYADFALTQRQWIQEERLTSQLQYWQQQLSGDIPALELPTDYRRSNFLRSQGKYQSLVLGEELTAALKTLSYKSGVSLFVTLMAAFQALLYCYTKQKDTIVCTPVASRHYPELKNAIGYFTNFVVLRTDLAGNPSFQELLGRVSQACLGAYPNQDIPIQKLAELPNLVRTPLTRAMLTLHSPHPTLNLDGLIVSSQYVEWLTNFDLSLSIQEKAGTLTVVAQYKTDLFTDVTIAQMLENFRTLVTDLVGNPNRHLNDLPSFAAPTQLQERENPENATPKQTKTFVAAQDEVEMQLLKIWKQVLGIETISVRDDFFELGGYSLLAVRLFTQIEQNLGVNLPLATLLQAPTIEQMASLLRQSDWVAPWHSLVPLQTSGSKAPLFCLHGGGFNVLIYRTLAMGLGSDRPVYALQAQGLDGKSQPHSRIEDMAADYIKQIRTVQPQGPYLLAGLSNGGMIALEMAQQLQQQGEKVALLAMFDTYGPVEREFLPPLSRLLSVCHYVMRYTLPQFISKHWRHGFIAMLTQFVAKLKSNERVNGKKIGFPTSDRDRAGSYLGKLSYIEYWIHKLNMFVLNHSSWALVYSPNPELMVIEGSLSQTVQQMEAAHHQANLEYIPSPYSGRITIFAASEQPPGFARDRQYGWRSIAVGEIDIHRVPGDHLTIMQSPVLVKKLQACMDKAMADT